MKNLLPYFCLLCFYFCSISLGYAQQNDITQWKQALAEAEKQGNSSQIAEYAQQIAVFYVQQNDYTTALPYTLAALKSAENLKNEPKNDQKVARLQFLLAKIYRLMVAV
jgi:hypothetical protein